MQNTIKKKVKRVALRTRRCEQADFVIQLETGHPRRSGRESKVLIALLIY